jgi:hypothetical protein
VQTNHKEERKIQILEAPNIRNVGKIRLVKILERGTGDSQAHWGLTRLPCLL